MVNQQRMCTQGEHLDYAIYDRHKYQTYHDHRENLYAMGVVLSPLSLE